MNCRRLMTSLVRATDRIVLFPRLSAGIRVEDRRTGRSSPSRVFSLSFAISLTRLLLLLAAAILAMRAVLLVCRMKRAKKIREKYRRKLKKLAKSRRKK